MKTLKEIQKEIDYLKSIYVEFNDKFRLNRQEKKKKADIGRSLFMLNVEAIGLLIYRDHKEGKK